MRRNLRGLIAVGAVLGMLVAASCDPVINRPIRGYEPGAAEAASGTGAPPTLQPNPQVLSPSALPSPSPGTLPSPSPSVLASPSAEAAPPIVRSVEPAGGAQVGVGTVRIAAVLIGRGSDLASASLSVDGAGASGAVSKDGPRQWTVSLQAPLDAGEHTAQVIVLDEAGGRGGFTWRFTVGTPEPAEGPPAVAATSGPNTPRPSAPTATAKPRP